VGIKRLAESVTMNRALLRISLTKETLYDNLSDDALQAITNCLEVSNTLQQINIPWCMLKSDGVRKYLASVEASKVLQKLHISGLHLLHSDTIAIGSCFQHNKSVSELKLSNVCMTHEEEVFVINYANTLYKTLKLFWRAIEESNVLPFNCEVLGSKLYLHCQEIAICTVWDDLFHNISSQSEVTTPAVRFAIEKKLQLLHRKATSVAYYLCTVPSHYFTPNLIETVNHTIWTIMFSSRLKMIADGIQVNTSLQYLEMSWFRIQDEGAEIISDCIMYHKSIKELRLINTNIDSEGAIKLFKAVQVNEVLQKLDVSHNDISDDGALAIVECLRTNTTLQCLNISCNKICNDGISSIFSCLKVNRTLKEICLSSDKISDEIASRFSTALKINSSLCTLIIMDYSGSSYSFSQIVLSAVLYNNTIKTLALPCVQKHEELCVLKNCVENINLNRRTQEIDVLIVNFRSSSEYHTDMYDYCRF